jgi:DNA-binding SARP family transcriptional activator
VANGIVLRLLGPVEVQVHDAWSTPRKPQQRLVMAMLALRAGQVVPVDELIDAVWEEHPPRSARGSLQVLMTRLRQTLARMPGGQLERCGDAYRLRMEPDGVDVHQFRSLARAGRAAADGRAAVAAFDQALALWRGPALADVRGTARVEAIRSTLAEEHLGAVQDRIGGLLDCGLEREAAAELPGLLARHPLAERLAGMFMVALSRCGQRGDALQVFRDTRGRLCGELGVEPGPELQSLHQQILAGADLAAPPGDGRPAVARPAAVLPGPRPAADAQPGVWSSGPFRPGTLRLAGGYPSMHTALMRPEAGYPATGPAGAYPASAATSVRYFKEAAPLGSARSGPAVPRLLPAAPAHFAGRAWELGALNELLGQAMGADGRGVIWVIDGTAGVGKTALAVYWAHRVADEFPDGQLYVNLRGFGPSGCPLTPEEAIRGLLAALQVPSAQIPDTLDAQAALYRSTLAGKRMLILLDNARDESQVRPLLPGSAACPVLITSRSQLTGLVAAEGAHPLSLDVLSEEGACELLTRKLGGRRVGAEPEAARELAGLCAGLPLARTPAPGCRSRRSPPSCRARGAGSTRWRPAMPRAACGRCSPGPAGSSAARRRACSGCWACTPGRTSPFRPPRACSAARWRRRAARWPS